MTEKIVNFGTSTLASTITSSATSLTVVSAASFPSSGNFRITVETELMLVTGVSGAIFTVTRGVEGSTPAAHVSGTKVTQTITATGLLNYIGNYRIFDICANRPAAGVRGRLFKASDAPLEFWDDGTKWITVCQDIVMPYGPINLTNWNWHNQGSATATQYGETIFFNCPGSGGDNWRFLYKSIPTAPYTITAGIFMPGAANLRFTLSTLGLWNSSSGQIKTHNILIDGSEFNISVDYYNSDSSYSNGYYRASNQTQNPVFFKVVDDTSNLTFSVCSDGQNYVTINSQSTTNFMTPDSVILGMDNTYSGSTTFQSYYVLSYTETSP